MTFERSISGRLVPCVCGGLAILYWFLFVNDHRPEFNRLNASGEGTAKLGQPGKPKMPADEARQRLIEGNQRFVSGESRHPHEMRGWRNRLVEGQHPFATILGCSDSRVPPELLFDQGFGDLFIVRVAGNIVNPDVTGSIEYGVDHLNTSLVVVLGHQSCGAVTASLASLMDLEQEAMEIQSLLNKIQPSLESLDRKLPHNELIERAVELNVRQSVEQLKKIPDLKDAIEQGKVEIVGAVYELSTGKVRFLEGANGNPSQQSHSK